MGVLLEQRSRLIYITASFQEQNGLSREIVIENRPQYAVVYLQGAKETYSIAWETIYQVAKEHHARSVRIEAEAQRKGRGTTGRKR